MGHLLVAPRGLLFPLVSSHGVPIVVTGICGVRANQFSVRCCGVWCALGATVDAWKDLTAGIVGGFALVAAGHPLDTVCLFEFVVLSVMSFVFIRVSYALKLLLWIMIEFLNCLLSEF